MILLRFWCQFWCSTFDSKSWFFQKKFSWKFDCKFHSKIDEKINAKKPWISIRISIEISNEIFFRKFYEKSIALSWNFNWSATFVSNLYDHTVNRKLDRTMWFIADFPAPLLHFLIRFWNPAWHEMCHTSAMLIYVTFLESEFCMSLCSTFFHIFPHFSVADQMHSCDINLFFVLRGLWFGRPQLTENWKGLENPLVENFGKSRFAYNCYWFSMLHFYIAFCFIW